MRKGKGSGVCGGRKVAMCCGALRCAVCGAVGGGWCGEKEPALARSGSSLQQVRVVTLGWLREVRGRLAPNWE